MAAVLLGCRSVKWRTFFRLSRGERVMLFGLGLPVLGLLLYLGGYRRGIERAVLLLRGEADVVVNALAAKYGASRNTDLLEEWIVRDFFHDKRGGIFVDVGANDYKHSSNTYYLETALGWSGIAVEPQTKYADGYRRYRPRTTFVPMLITDQSEPDALFYVPTSGNNAIASVSKDFAESEGSTVEAVHVPSITLDDLLVKSGLSRIDYLSIDIELAEPLALAGFSIERFRPQLVSIEAHEPVRQQILDYFARHGYVLVGRYWQADNVNFWFMPQTRE